VAFILKNSITFLNKRTFPTNNLGKMATNRDLLKEAIADAKAVKETAIANAKAALEEAFAPQVQAMFAAKLQEMEHEDEFGEALGTINDPDTPTAHGNIAEEDLEEGGYDEEHENPVTGERVTAKDVTEVDEIDLEELLKELEMEEGDMEESLNEAEGDEEDDTDVSDEDSDEDDDEGTPLDLEDMTDEDLKSMIEDVIKDMIASGELEGGEEGIGDEEGMKMKDEEEVDLAELLREIEEMENIDSLEEAKKKKEEKKEEKEDEDKKKMKKELDEAYSVIKSLKSELNEINLLNAKLLYTNKIFKAKNLNESQKVKVLSSFDKATTVGEVKLVFETLNEGIKVKSNLIKENLGSASKSTITPNVKKPIVESNEAFLRMQKLAGII
jgi:hypothetical protein